MVVTVLLNIYVESKELDRVTSSLKQLPEIVDLFEVTGDYDIVALVRAENMRRFRDFLKNRVLSIKGVRGTNSAVILYTHKRDGKMLEE
jgi:DNA-binding Lrp family transcriptional regulator